MTGREPEPEQVFDADRTGRKLVDLPDFLMGEAWPLQSPSQTSFRVGELDEMSARSEVMR